MQNTQRGGASSGATQHILIGTKVWVNVQDERRLFELGEVTHISDEREYSVLTAGNRMLKVGVEALTPTIEQGGKPVEDLLHLSDFSEESLLHSLRERYEDDEFYSMVGPILVSINPYKWCDIYSKHDMASYRGKRKAQVKPHVFLTAENAYRAAVEGSGDGSASAKPGANQAIIISGESGAGKTEATKIIMKYLSSAGRQFCDVDDSEAKADAPRGLEQRVLDSNPLLEAFGNAKTVRNDNSSRFGKFIEIDIDDLGLIKGAKVLNYLLEKSRIIGQGEGERNYHIFYQLLRGGPPELLEEIGLGGFAEQDIAYIAEGADLVLQEENDAPNFARTVQCLTTVGVTDEERASVFQTLAAVLLLGQICILDTGKDQQEGSHCSADELGAAAHALGLDEEDLEAALCSNVVTVGGETIHTPVKSVVARGKRDALAKALYALLFRWLIQRVNTSLAGHAMTVAASRHPVLRRSASLDSTATIDSLCSPVAGRSIGILDIYGFEVFETNSFEQFAINFANERLQRHFNKYIFEVEQDEYASEGIDWSRIEFNDNQACLDLIESSNVSLLSLLDEECLMPRGSDQSLLRKLHTNHKGIHPHYVFPRFGNDACFGVAHYAGTVQYTVDGFLQKNNDSLSEGLASAMLGSALPWYQGLFGGARASKSAKQRSRKRAASLRPPTVSEQFRKQLNTLMTRLEACEPHFVRCIKPNDVKRPGFFHSQKCLEQLRHAGMLETIRIRDQGYALREPHEAFFRRFRVLAPGARDCKDLVRLVSRGFGLEDNAHWQLGHTKVFLRRELAEKLDRTVASRLTAASRIIARAIRRALLNKRLRAVERIAAFFVRVRFVVFVRKVVRVQAFVRGMRARVAFRDQLAKAMARRQREIESAQGMWSSPDSSPASPEAGSDADGEKQSRTPPPAGCGSDDANVRLADLANNNNLSQAATRPSAVSVATSPARPQSLTPSRLRPGKTRSPMSPRRSTPRSAFPDQELALLQWEQREKSVVSRLCDLDCFVQALYGIDGGAGERSGRSASTAAGDSRLSPKTMEDAVDTVFKTIQQRIRGDGARRRDENDLVLRAESAERRLKELESQLAESRESTVLANKRAEEAMQQCRFADSSLEQSRLKIAALKQQVEDQSAELDSLQKDLHVSKNNQADARKEDDEEESKSAEPAVSKGIIDGNAASEATAAMMQQLPASITSLMKENIALMDEIVETRARHNTVLRKLAQADSRAEHAEQANETLCTLLSWRDEQIEAIVKKDAAAVPPIPDPAFVKAISDLQPYLREIAHKYESKLPEGM